MIHDIVAELNNRYASRVPLIALHTAERDRGLRYIKTVIADPMHVERNRALYVWTCRKGIRQVAGPGMKAEEVKTIDASIRDGAALVDYLERYCDEVRAGAKPQGIFVLCDIGPFIAPYGQEDPQVTCGLRDIADLGKTRSISLIFLGPSFPQLDSLDREVLHLTLPLPGEDEARSILTGVVDQVQMNPKAGELDLDLTQERREATIPLLLGLTATEMESRLLYAIRKNRGLGHGFLETLIAEKRQIIGRTGAVSWHHSRSRETLGGYKGLIALLEEMAETFTPAARAFGLARARGLLAVGLPGTGKDHAMTVAASIFNLPLYRMDASFMGAGGGILGAAETIMKDTLARVETQPSMLGISEFEKAFGGMATSHQSDGGAAARVGAIMLNWMAEQEGVFVFATANDISQLAPEQVRQGRFDQIVFFDLPRPADRAEIAAIHLRAARQDPATVDLDQVAVATEDFSGAEIAAAVIKATRRAFRDGQRAVATEDLQAAAAFIRPSTLAVMKKDDIERTREWARRNGAIDVAALGEGQATAHDRQVLDF